MANTPDAHETCEMLEKCRDLLLIGLASYGEIERLGNAQANRAFQLYAPDEEGVERPIHQELMVIHPTGDSATVSDFAEALRYVDILMRKTRGLTEAVQS